MLTEEQFQEALHPLTDNVIPKGEEDEGNMKNILLQFLEPAFSLENSHFGMLRDNPFCDLSRSTCSLSQ